MGRRRRRRASCSVTWDGEEEKSGFFMGLGFVGEVGGEGGEIASFGGGLSAVERGEGGRGEPSEISVSKLRGTTFESKGEKRRRRRSSFLSPSFYAGGLRQKKFEMGNGTQ